MAKSKKERRSSIRHMSAEGDVLAIFEALDRVEKDESAGSSTSDAASASDDDLDDADVGP